MSMLKSPSIALVATIVILGSANINLDYQNCRKATKHSYISKAGADHISAICEAFIKEEVMVK